MSSAPSGGVPITFSVDRSAVDAYLAELRQGVPAVVRPQVESTPGATFAGGGVSAIPSPATPGAAGTPTSSLADLRQPIPVQLDLSAARNQWSAFVSEMGISARSAMSGVGVQAAGITQIPSGAGSAFVVPSQVLGQSVNGGQIQSNINTATGPPDVRSLSEQLFERHRRTGSFADEKDVTSEDRAAEQALRNQRAILEGPAWAAAHREEFGRLPSRRDVVGRFGADTDVAQAVADDARDVHGRGRQQERRAAAEARLVKQEQKEAAIAQRQEANERIQSIRRDAVARGSVSYEGGEGEGSEGGRGGSGRIFGLRAGRLGQVATAGIIAMEGLRVGLAVRDYNNQMGLAEGHEDRYKAEMGLIDTIGSIPIAGQIANLATGGFLYGNQKLIADAQRQDQHAEVMQQSGLASLDLRNRADLASASPFQRPDIEIRQKQDIENRAIADRARERAEQQEKETQARLSAIDYQSSLSVPLWNRLSSTEKEQAIRGVRSDAARAASQSNVQEGSEREDAARQAYGAIRDNRESRRNQAESYDIQRLQYRADAQPFRDRVTDRQLERNADDLKEAEMRLQRGGGVANQFRRANQEKYNAEDAEYQRQTSATQIGLYGGARSALLRGGGDPFAAQQNDIFAKGQASLVQNRNAALVAPIIAGNLAELGANFQTMFRQFSVAQGQTQFQSQSIEAAIAHDPLQARILGLRGERLGALDEADRSTPAGPLREARETSVNRLYDDRERYEKQQDAESVAGQRFGIREQGRALDLIINPPKGNPALGRLEAGTENIFGETVGRAFAAGLAGHPDVERDALGLGAKQLQGQRAEFLQGLTPTEIDPRRTALSGSGTVDVSEYLKDMAEKLANLAAMKADLAKVAAFVGGVNRDQ